MNEDQYRDRLRDLLNEAAKTNDAGTILAGLVASLGSVLAITTMTSGLNRNEAIEIARHQLDLSYIYYLRYYQDAANKAA